MMEIKAVSIYTIIILLIFAALASAQSGRRVQTETAPPALPSVQITQDVQEAAAEESVGYSESSPNAPRSISPNRRSDKKIKKESKKTAPTTTQTTDAAASVPANADDEVLKIETNLVTIPVAVYDRNGLYIPNLRQTDFKVFEDGAEQETAYFGVSEKPFTVILLIDVSPSTEYKIEDIQTAAIAFVDQLKPQDNVLVIQFDERVSVLAEATNDRQKIHKAIRRTNFGGGTSLYEAVDFTLRKRLEKVEGRKAIVLFTDGVDTASIGASFEGTVRDAEESDALIFPIYYNTFLANRGICTGGVMSSPPILGVPFPGGGSGQGSGASSAEYTRGRVYLTQLAAATGGKVFRPDSTPGGLTAAFESIAEELRRQYSIGYYPQIEGTAGQRKQIRVRVNRPKLVIRSRDSYIVGTADQSAAAN